MKNHLLIFLNFLFTIVTFNTYAITTTWDGTAWDNGEPDWTNSLDIVTISGDLSITSDVSVASLTISNGATFTVNGNLDVGGGGDNLASSGTGSSLVVTNQATFFNGSLTTISQDTFMSIGGDMTNNNNSENLEISGSVTVTGDLTNGTGAIISNPNGTGSLSVGGTITNDGIIGEGAVGSNSLGSLPVTLSSFEAIPAANGIKIIWRTSSELNNSHFEVLRSYNLTDFEVIAVVEGAGTSNLVQGYQYMDHGVSGVVYYKLRQVDFDGKSEEFEIVKVDFVLSESDVSTYPNPTFSDSFNLHVQGIGTESHISITVINMKGAVVHSETMASDAFGRLNREITLPDDKGILTLIIQTDENIIKRKLVNL